MESFNLNIIPGKDRPVCHASQYDIGRTIHVNLFEGFNVFTLDGTEVISISVRKPDGNVVTESVTNTSDSYVEFVTTEQMTACHGSNLCELKLEKGADVIGTMNFILEVEQDPLDGGVQSDTNIHNLQTQVADLVAIEVADQYDSANVIFDAAPVPGHGNGYAVTSEGVATELALKQDVTDNNLTTTDHTIVGAINELNTAKAEIDDATPSATTVYSSDKIEEITKVVTFNGNPAAGDEYHFALNTGWTVSNFVFSRRGNLCHLHGQFVRSTPISTWEMIGRFENLPANKSIKPVAELALICGADNEPDTPVSRSTIRIVLRNTDGYLQASNDMPTARRLYIDIVWEAETSEV